MTTGATVAAGPGAGSTGAPAGAAAAGAGVPGGGGVPGAGGTPGEARAAAVRAMLEARTVAVVGASDRSGSFGARMIEEVAKSRSRPQVYLVNPKYATIGSQRCYPSLADLPAAVDLVLLGVPDAALETQLELAASRGDRSAVIFGTAHADARARAAGAGQESAGGAVAGQESCPAPPLRHRLAQIARSAGMELCGGGCMGFANVSFGLRAMGYIEPDPLPAGPVALVTHSGSVFSTLLRARRAIGFTVAVSSGQELVTATPAYLRYALELRQTRVLALVLEAMRDAGQLRQVLAAAAGRQLPVVLLTAGSSAAGRDLVTAHSGALAAGDGGWEALCRAYGVHRVTDLAELADSLELFALRASRPASRTIAAQPPAAQPPAAQPRESQPHSAEAAAAGPHAAPRRGLATVHDSGLERAHLADLAASLGVPYAEISEQTTAALAGLLDPGLEPANPLDVWGTGDQTQQLFASAMITLAADDAVGAVALAVDLVPELDGDRGYPLALIDAAAATDKPVAVLSNLASVLDPEQAATLRTAGIAVLEGSRSGLLALAHLLEHQARSNPVSPAGAPAGPGHPGQGPAGSGTAAGVDREARASRARALVASGRASGAPLLRLLGEYGIQSAAVLPAASAGQAQAAARQIGFPVVLKTDEPAIAHKSDAGGVVLQIQSAGQLAAAYADMAVRLGPRVLVCQQVPAGVELAAGIAADPDLGPLVVLGAGGVLVEVLADRAVALPPLTASQALDMLAGLRVQALLSGARGAPPADLDAIAAAVTGIADLAADLADALAELDVNPLICGPAGVIAVDALLITRAPGGRGR